MQHEFNDMDPQALFEGPCQKHDTNVSMVFFMSIGKIISATTGGAFKKHWVLKSKSS